MDISVKQGELLEERGDVLVLPVFKDLAKGGSDLSAVDTLLDGQLLPWIEQDGFEGGEGDWYSLPVPKNVLKLRRIALLGLGDRKAYSLDTVRKAAATAVRRAREVNAKRLVTVLPPLPADALAREVAQVWAEGAWLSGYRFHAYKSKKGESQKAKDVRELVLVEQGKATTQAVERGVQAAQALVAGVVLARDLVNTPSADMTPQHLLEVAQEIARRDRRISIKVLDRARMEKLGMHPTLAVARGSMHEPVGVHLVYKPKGKTKKGASKRIALVGKAVTFDSGGLSLKPADGMMTMKIDMGGAASVLGAFRCLEALELDVEVHGIFLAVENMPSGHAYRPGDVVRAMNGTTIEVLNTDAEGRLTLADALSYAVKQEPNAIIELSTLTGACVAALGEDMAGLLTNDRKLGDRILSAARVAGEPLWELPLYAPYEEHIKSKIADIKNIGARGQAGTISAALFLQHFVHRIPWVHLDIAGPSYIEREARPDQPYGATGYGVRLLVRYLQAIS